MDSDTAPGESRRLDPLKGAVHGCPRNRMAEQEEFQVGRGRGLGHLEFLDVDGMHYEEVAVRAVAWRRRRTEVPSVAGVVGQCHRVARQIPAVSRPGRQVGYGGRDVGDSPMPET